MTGDPTRGTGGPRCRRGRQTGGSDPPGRAVRADSRPGMTSQGACGLNPLAKRRQSRHIEKTPHQGMTAGGTASRGCGCQWSLCARILESQKARDVIDGCRTLWLLHVVPISRSSGFPRVAESRPGMTSSRRQSLPILCGYPDQPISASLSKTHCDGIARSQPRNCAVASDGKNAGAGPLPLRGTPSEEPDEQGTVEPTQSWGIARDRVGTRCSFRGTHPPNRVRQPLGGKPGAAASRLSGRQNDRGNAGNSSMGRTEA